MTDVLDLLDAGPLVAEGGVSEVGLDLRPFGPNYAQFRIVNIGVLPWVNAEITLTLLPYEPEAGDVIPDGGFLGPEDRHARTFRRALVRPGEEILLTTPRAHPGDAGGMEIWRCCSLYGAAAVAVRQPSWEKAHGAVISDLAGYWNALVDADVVDSADRQPVSRDDFLHAVERLEAMNESLTQAVAGAALKLRPREAYRPPAWRRLRTWLLGDGPSRRERRREQQRRENARARALDMTRRIAEATEASAKKTEG